MKIEADDLYNQITALNQLSDSLVDYRKTLLERARAIEAILDGKVTHYFDRQDSDVKLVIISNSYYQALNESLQSHSDKAKSLFEQIARENPELFYVQEARKYLEAHAND